MLKLNRKVEMTAEDIFQGRIQSFKIWLLLFSPVNASQRMVVIAVLKVNFSIVVSVVSEKNIRMGAPMATLEEVIQVVDGVGEFDPFVVVYVRRDSTDADANSLDGGTVLFGRSAGSASRCAAVTRLVTSSFSRFQASASTAGRPKPPMSGSQAVNPLVFISTANPRFRGEPLKVLNCPPRASSPF